MTHDELLDLVDGNDQVIGTIYRSEHDDTIVNPTQFIRGIDIYLVNNDAKLWVPTRTMHKKIAPGALDLSCGGHVDSGETYEQAALRELQEELNITLQPGELRLIDKIRSDSIGYFRSVYTYHTDKTPHYNPDDFTSAEWLSPVEILQKIEDGVPAKRSITETINLLQAHGY